MLMTAAVVTILFRKLKMPMILGYIVAGFLISPYFPLFFGVENQNSIETWSEIGVIIILFHIGLEFDLHKIADIGSTAIVSAAVKMSGVLACGYGFGKLIGLHNMDCLFLGAMLSISSTVVIKKCFEEIDVSREKYPALVMGSLVMEDVFSIFMMIILTTISASKTINGLQLALNLGLMVVYLIIWIVLGIYILPTVLNKVMDLMSDEMLTVLSIGFCFAMALLADTLGFSGELGAFIAGSLMASTMHANRIENITKGVKDIFGAMFFLSVGMMVDPSVIIQRWTTIVPIAILAVIVKLIFATIGMVMSGQDLKTSIKGGVSLAPIGEFSFIIASLGISLGVMDQYLYPVIVAASILTIVFTPSLIKNGDRIVHRIEKVIPDRLLRMITRYTSHERNDGEHAQEWRNVIKAFFQTGIVYGSIMFAAAVIGVGIVEPMLSDHLPQFAAKLLTCLLIYAAMAIFVRPLLDFHSVSFSHLWFSSFANRPPLVMLIALKFLILAVVAYIPIERLWGVDHLLPIAAIIIALFVFGRTDFIQTRYLQIETRFLRNLNEKTLEETGHEMGARHWLDEDYSICSFVVPNDSPYAGVSLIDLGWGKNLDIYVVKIEREGRSRLMPSGKAVLKPGDKVYIVGEDSSLTTFYKTLGFTQTRPFRTLKEFMGSDYPDPMTALACGAIKVNGSEPYAGTTIRNSNIQHKYNCMILGIQKDGLTVKMPDANMVIDEGDIMWVIGSNNRVGQLAALSVEPDNKNSKVTEDGSGGTNE